MNKLGVIEGGNGLSFWIYFNEYTNVKIGNAYTTKARAIANANSIPNLDRSTVEGLYPKYEVIN